MTTGPLLRALALAAVGGLAVTIPVACSSDKPAVCSDADSLKAAVSGLGDNIRGSTNPLDKLSSQVAAVSDSFTQLKTDAKQQFSSQINAMSGAVSGLKDSVNAAKSNPSAATIQSVVSDASTTKTAGQSLTSAVKNTC